jgi:hypothetical protein
VKPTRFPRQNRNGIHAVATIRFFVPDDSKILSAQAGFLCRFRTVGRKDEDGVRAVFLALLAGDDQKRDAVLITNGRNFFPRRREGQLTKLTAQPRLAIHHNHSFVARTPGIPTFHPSTTARSGQDSPSA